MIDEKKTLAFVSSRSGTGKTTLMEAMVKRLKGKGYRVGVVKHSGHEVSFDREGSDSWRLTRAGSDVTVLAARGFLAVLRAVDRPSLDTAFLEASSGTDIVLVEGFKEMAVPKIEVYRSAHCHELCCRGERGIDPHLVAVASDVPLDLDVPVLDLNDHDEIFGFILKRILGD